MDDSIEFNKGKRYSILLWSLVVTFTISVITGLSSDYRLFTFFGSFILSPIFVLILSKQRFSLIDEFNSHRGSKKSIFEISLRLLMGILIVMFVFLSVVGISGKYLPIWLVLLIFGFVFTSLMSVPISNIAYNVKVKSNRILDSYGKLKYFELLIEEDRLLIGKSKYSFKIKSRSTIHIKKTKSRNMFARKYWYLECQISNEEQCMNIPFIPISEKELSLSSTIQKLFVNTNCKTIIAEELLNTKNFFMKLIIPKVTDRSSNSVSTYQFFYR